jgi:hypothetical protein
MHQYKVIHKKLDLKGRSSESVYVIDVDSDKVKYFKKLGLCHFILGYVWSYKVLFYLFYPKFVCKSYSAKNYLTGEEYQYIRLS